MPKTKNQRKLRRYYITVNPYGGGKKASKILEKVLPVFQSANAEVTILETEYAGHTKDLVRDVNMSSYDGFCCIGGDGTMHEAVNGLMTRKDGVRFSIG